MGQGAYRPSRVALTTVGLGLISLFLWQSRNRNKAKPLTSILSKAELKALCVALPKIELHCHLSGSFRMSTLAKLTPGFSFEALKKQGMNKTYQLKTHFLKM